MGWPRCLIRGRLPLTRCYVFCLLLAGLAYIYLANNSSVQALFGVRDASALLGLVKQPRVFLDSLAWKLSWVLYFVVWCGPGIDQQRFCTNHSVQLYLQPSTFARNMSLVKPLFLRCFFHALPGFLLWSFFLFMLSLEAIVGSGKTSGWQAPSFLPVSYGLPLFHCWRWPYLCGSSGALPLQLCLLAIFILLKILGQAMNLILRTPWGYLLDLPYIINVIWSHLFRLTAMNRHGGNLDAIPLWSTWASLLAVCVLLFLAA